MIHFVAVNGMKTSLCEKDLSGKLFADNEMLVDCEECLKRLGLLIEISESDIVKD